MIPPTGQIGENGHAEMVAYLSGLAEEAAQARREWEPLVEINLQLYTWGQVGGPPDAGRIVVNEIQNAIITTTDVQTKEPPRCTLEPVETGEPPLHYWAGPADLGVTLGLQAFEVAEWIDPATGVAHPPTPLDPLVAGRLKALAVPEELSPALPPGTIRPDWIVEVTDRLVAETYQSVFNVLWERSNTDRWVRKNLLDTNIQGWAFGLYEFDDGNLKHALRHLPITQVYIDPTVHDVAEAAYAGFDLPLDAAEAKAQFPELADAIEAEAREGAPSRPDAMTRWSATYDRDFRRKMVVMRVFWLRNQPIPLAPHDPIATAEPLAFPDEAAAEGAMIADPGTTALEPAIDETTDDAPFAALLMRYGVRQVIQIGGRIVDDRECEFADIPLLHNVNIPLPGQRPWGIGEPYRQKCLQEAESRLLNSMVEHSEYFSAPVTAMSQSMRDSLPPQYRDAGVKPGLTLVVPDDQWAMSGGKIQTVIEPAPTPPALVQLFPVVKGLLQEIGGHTDVVQGRTTPDAKSGRAIDLLQTATTSTMGFKAARTGDMVKRLADLMLHSIVWRLDVEQVGRIVSRYPRHVLEVIHRRARDVEWNVRVAVQAGNVGPQAQRRQMAQMDLQAGAIGLQSYRERAGLDHRVEEQRLDAERAKLARTAAVAPTDAKPRKPHSS